MGISCPCGRPGLTNPSDRAQLDSAVLSRAQTQVSPVNTQRVLMLLSHFLTGHPGPHPGRCAPFAGVIYSDNRPYPYNLASSHKGGLLGAPGTYSSKVRAQRLRLIYLLERGAVHVHFNHEKPAKAVR